MNNIQPHIILGKLLKNKLSSDDYGKYHYGNVNEIKELMRMSSVKGGLYPLIWCELPLTNPVQSPIGLTANLRVFLATPSRKEWLNDERQIETYEKVLNPLYDKFCSILKKSDSFQLIDRQINRNDLPNFYTAEIGTRDNQSKNQVEEYWDVITLDFRSIVFADKCDVKVGEDVNTDITLNFDYQDLGNNEYRLFWTTENAYRTYLNNELVSNNGEKVVVVNDEEKGTFTLFSYNNDYKTAFETIIIDNTSIDPRITYANRISEDGGEIVGFDQLENNINAPVGRKEGKLYAFDEDDYSVVANGNRWELTRKDGYREVPANVPRFDWSNGIQELLVEGQSTNLFESINLYTSNKWLPNNGSISNSLNNNFIFNDGNVIDRHFMLYNGVNIPDTDRYSISVIVEKLDHQWIQLNPVSGFNPEDWANFDLENGLIGDRGTDAEAYITRINNSDKYLCELVIRPSSAGVKFARLCVSTNDEDSSRYPSYQGTNADCFIVSYPQIEKSQLINGEWRSTSRIITNGSIVTRPADIITNSQGQLAPGRYDSV